METVKDFWYWLAMLVSVVSMLVWVLSSTLNVGDAYLRWGAAAVVVLAMGSVAVRAALKVRRVVWSEELKDAQRRRLRHQVREVTWETLPLGLVLLGMLVLQKLVGDAVLPQCAGAILLLGLLAGWTWLGQIL